jgi:hypothetical protein
MSAMIESCRRIGAVALVLLTSGACSYSYVDANNVRHVVGLVDMSIAPANIGSEPVASAVSVTSVGVHVYSGTANGGGVVLGYGRETVLLIPNNACIDLNSPGPCQAARNASSRPATAEASP